jgi:uncharacterized membrane protein YebE (DUF533 family)
MNFDFDHITQMITALALAYIAYQNHTGNKQARENGEEIARTHAETKKVGVAIDGVLEAAKADTKTESDRLLNESVAAARAEGVIEGKAEESADQTQRDAERPRGLAL